MQSLRERSTGPTPTDSPMCYLENSEHEINLLYQSCTLGTALWFLIHREPVSIKVPSSTYTSTGMRRIESAFPADEWDRVWWWRIFLRYRTLNNSQRTNEPEAKPTEAIMRRRKMRYMFKNEAIASNHTMTDWLTEERSKHSKKERGTMEAEKG